MKKQAAAAPAAKTPLPARKTHAATDRKPRPPAQSKKPSTAREAADGKGDTILAMLKAPGGATSIDIGKAVGWLPNSIRGFFWNLKKKGVVVTTSKEKGKPTVYAIVEAKGAKGQPTVAVGDVI